MSKELKKRGRPKGSKNKKSKLVPTIPEVSDIPKEIISVPENLTEDKPEKVEPALIKSFLKTMGRICEAKGQTIQEAIINLKPEVAKGTGILTLEKGEIKKEKIIPHRLILRLFGQVSRISKEIALKNVLLMFDKNLFEK